MSYDDLDYDEYDEPGYEPEDIGCLCNDAGLDSEWEWRPDLNCYVCVGCGAVQ